MTEPTRSPRDMAVEMLEQIAALGGKTLLGPRWDTERHHEVGAAKAFEQAAELAREALSALSQPQLRDAPSEMELLDGIDEDELLTIIARSIGRTTGTANHHERAQDVLRSVREADLTLPTPTSIDAPDDQCKAAHADTYRAMLKAAPRSPDPASRKTEEP